MCFPTIAQLSCDNVGIPRLRRPWMGYSDSAIASTIDRLVNSVGRLLDR